MTRVAIHNDIVPLTAKLANREDSWRNSLFLNALSNQLAILYGLKNHTA